MRIFATILFAAATLAAQTAASLQAESIARQRASAQKQMGATASSGFFVLPPPARLGATIFASAPLNADCEPLPAADVNRLVANAAQRENLDENLLRGVMSQESGFRPCAVSPKGALGLMQLMPSTVRQFDVRDPFDPAQNVEAGARFLKDLLGRYNGDLTLVLGAYNAGPARVDAAAGVPPIPETQDYIRKILSVLPTIGK